MNDLFEHKILHERTCNLGSGSRRTEIECMLFFPDRLVIYAVSEFVCYGEDIVQLSRMIQENERRLGQEMVDAKSAAVLALPRVSVDLSVLDEPGKDLAELAVELAHHRVDKVH